MSTNTTTQQNTTIITAAAPSRESAIPRITIGDLREFLSACDQAALPDWLAVTFLSDSWGGERHTKKVKANYTAGGAPNVHPLGCRCGQTPTCQRNDGQV